MDEPVPRPPYALEEIESIANLDTARMTLRWALERLQKLEGELRDARAKAASEGLDKDRALSELAAAQRSLSLRTVQELERGRYYQRLEEYLSLSLGGQLDLGALAKRELEVKGLQELLEAKRTGLEREHQARLEALEAQWRRRQAELESESRAARIEAERVYAGRKAALESEAVAKAAELRERENTVRREEEALEERRQRFEDHSSSQRARLRSELKGLREEVESEVRLRAELSERLVRERQASLEEGWSRERALLLKELASWRGRAQDLGPKLLELEKALDVSEEAAKRARAAADRQTLILADYQQSWETEKGGLEEEAARWKEKAREDLAKVHDLGRRLAQAEEAVEKTRAAAERQIALLEDHRRLLEETQERLIAELKEARRREAEALRGRGG